MALALALAYKNRQWGNNFRNRNLALLFHSQVANSCVYRGTVTSVSVLATASVVVLGHVVVLTVVVRGRQSC